MIESSGCLLNQDTEDLEWVLLPDVWAYEEFILVKEASSAQKQQQYRDYNTKRYTDHLNINKRVSFGPRFWLGEPTRYKIPDL